MAVTYPGELTYVSFPIKKFEEDSDGNLRVTGTVTDGSVDSDRQIVDPEASAKMLADWMDSGPNVRVMHSPALYPAGRGLKVDLGGFSHNLEGLIVEDTAKKLVRNKVLRAWSIGIANPVIKRDPTGKAPGGIVVGGTLAEVSLVDRPANKNCQLVLAKSVESDVPWSYGDLEALLAKAEKAEPGDNVDEPDDEPEAAEPDTDEVHKSYLSARDEWLAREPKPVYGDLPRNGTAFLVKQAARDQWQVWDVEGDREGYGSFVAWCAKRDVRPEVGGGVDVDKLPAEDFVDSQGRRFPIHSAGDVSDAVSSYGRADPPIPMKNFRRRLTAIAHRKGPEFVAALPESWGRKTVEKDITTTSPNSTGLVPYNLVGGGKDENMMEPDLTKAVKCPNCGADNPGSGLCRCDSCGRKLSKAAVADMVKVSQGGWSHGWKRAAPEVHEHLSRAHEAFATGRHGEVMGHLEAAHSAAGKADTKADRKAGRDIVLAGMRTITKSYAKGSGSGKASPTELRRHTRLAEAHNAVAATEDTIRRTGSPNAKAAQDAALSTIDRHMPRTKSAGGADMTKGKERRLLPPDVAEAGEHREPDGSAVEALEADAGMSTTPDETPDVIPASMKGKKGKLPFPGAAPPFKSKDEPDDDEPDEPDEPDTAEKSYGVQRMHDALCAAYDWTTITDVYPAVKMVTDAVDPAWFRRRLSVAYQQGDLAKVGPLAGSVGEAELFTSGRIDPTMLADGRASLHKAFTDMYPDAHPSPSAVTPGQFQRPYISAGHSPLNAGMASGAPNIPPASHVIDPDEFQRGYITEGHAADSPSNTGNNLTTPTVSSGAARTYYTNASKDAARSAMAAMHDHIAGTFPDMCPMAASKAVMPADMFAGSRPVPTRVPEMGAANAVGKSKKDLRKMVEAAVTKATGALSLDYETRIAALHQELEDLASQPDPAQAPLRGVVRTPATSETDQRSPLVEKAVKEAQQHHAEWVQYLATLAKSDSPQIREQAEELLTKVA